MANVPYTKEQIAFIEVHHAGITAAELTELFNDAFHESRSKNGIQYLLQKKGWKCVKRPNTWADGFTTEQKEFMRHHGANMSRRELAELFNSHFGTSVCLSTIKGWCGRNKIPSPNGNGRFTTETSPRWQKGLSVEEFKSHYTEESYQKMMGPMCQSHIKYHIGDEVIRQGVPYIVISENYDLRFEHRLEKKAVHVWKKHYGDVPPKYMIINLDSNKMNCDIRNLRCIPVKYRAFLRWNNWWDAPAEVKETALKWCELFYTLKEP